MALTELFGSRTSSRTGAVKQHRRIYAATAVTDADTLIGGDYPVADATLAFNKCVDAKGQPYKLPGLWFVSAEYEGLVIYT